MPTATFTADFSKWNEALKNAATSLQPLELKAKGVQQQLQKMAESLSGAKIIKEAQLATKAVEAIGGVTKLTEREQAKLNATVTEAIAKYAALGQKAPADMLALAEATKKAETATAANAVSFKTLVASYVTGLATFQTAKRALEAFVGFLSSSIDSYAEAEQGQKRLNVALQNAGRATPEVIKQYGDLATEFQRTTTFSDDLITSTEALFTQIGNVGPQEMEAALSATTDLAEGLGIDLEQAATAVAKATEGQTTALHKLAPSLDEAALKGGDLATIAAEIEKHFGSQAAEALDTYAGRVKQLANNWDNVQEKIGGFIVSNDLVIAGLRALSEAVDKASTTQGNLNTTLVASSAAGVVFGAGFDSLIVLLDEYAKSLNEAERALRKFVAGAPSLAQLFPNDKLREFNAQLRAMAAGGLAEWDKQNDAIDKAARAAEEAAKKFKALRDEISGAKIEQDLRDLKRAWDALTPAEKQQAVQIGIVTDRYVALASKLPKLPPDLKAFARAMNTAAQDTGRMTLVIGQLHPLIEVLGKAVDETGKAFTDWGKEVGFEATIPLINFGKALQQTEGFMTRLPESIDKVEKSTRTLSQSLGDLSSAFSELAQISGGSLSGVLGTLSKLVGSANVGVKAVEGIGDSLDAISAAKASGSITGLIGGFAGLAAGIASAAAAAISFGKALYDALTKSRPEELVESIARDFGEPIGEELGKRIAERAVKEFKGSFQAAQVASLDEIISAGGGITTQNLDKLMARLHDVFSLLETGELTAAQAQDVLNKNFQTFADFLGGDVNPELKEIIRLNQEFGTQSQAIIDYIAKNADRAAKGFNTIAKNLAALTSGFQTGSDELKNLMDALDSAGGAGPKGPKEAPEAHPGVEEQKRKSTDAFAPEFVDNLQKQLDRIAPLAEATFGALLAGGKSVTEALAEMAPGLAEIEKLLHATGTEASGFLGQVIGWEGIVNKNKELFEVLGGVTDMLKGLNNAGALSQDAFSALTATVADAFGTLTAQGTSASDALMLMQPQLQEIWELQKDFGYEVDASTQKLIDQAVAAGEVGEKHRSVQEQTLDVMKHLDAVLAGIGEQFGVHIPEDVAKTGKAFDDVTVKIDDMVDHVPKQIDLPVNAPTDQAETDVFEWQKNLPPNVTIPIIAETDPAKKGFDDWFDQIPDMKTIGINIDLPDVPTVHVPVQVDYPEGPDNPTHAVPFAKGGPVYAARGFYAPPRGTDTVPAYLTPGEFVISRKGVQAAGVPALRDINAGNAPQSGSGSVTTINVYVDHKLDVEQGMELAKIVAPHIPGAVATGGKVYSEWRRMHKGLAR